MAGRGVDEDPVAVPGNQVAAAQRADREVDGLRRAVQESDVRVAVGAQAVAGEAVVDVELGAVGGAVALGLRLGGEVAPAGREVAQRAAAVGGVGEGGGQGGEGGRFAGQFAGGGGESGVLVGEQGGVDPAGQEVGVAQGADQQVAVGGGAVQAGAG